MMAVIQCGCRNRRQSRHQRHDDRAQLQRVHLGPLGRRPRTALLDTAEPFAPQGLATAPAAPQRSTAMRPDEVSTSSPKMALAHTVGDKVEAAYRRRQA